MNNFIFVFLAFFTVFHLGSWATETPKLTDNSKTGQPKTTVKANRRSRASAKTPAPNLDAKKVTNRRSRASAKTPAPNQEPIDKNRIAYSVNRLIDKSFGKPPTATLNRRSGASAKTSALENQNAIDKSRIAYSVNRFIDRSFGSTPQKAEATSKRGRTSATSSTSENQEAIDKSLKARAVNRLIDRSFGTPQKAEATSKRGRTSATSSTSENQEAIDKSLKARAVNRLIDRSFGTPQKPEAKPKKKPATKKRSPKPTTATKQTEADSSPSPPSPPPPPDPAKPTKRTQADSPPPPPPPQPAKPTRRTQINNLPPKTPDKASPKPVVTTKQAGQVNPQAQDGLASTLEAPPTKTPKWESPKWQEHPSPLYGARSPSSTHNVEAIIERVIPHPNQSSPNFIKEALSLWPIDKGQHFQSAVFALSNPEVLEAITAPLKTRVKQALEGQNEVSKYRALELLAYYKSSFPNFPKNNYYDSIYNDPTIHDLIKAVEGDQNGLVRNKVMAIQILSHILKDLKQDIKSLSQANTKDREALKAKWANHPIIQSIVLKELLTHTKESSTLLGSILNIDWVNKEAELRNSVDEKRELTLFYFNTFDLFTLNSLDALLKKLEQYAENYLLQMQVRGVWNIILNHPEAFLKELKTLSKSYQNKYVEFYFSSFIKVLEVASMSYNEKSKLRLMNLFKVVLQDPQISERVKQKVRAFQKPILKHGTFGDRITNGFWTLREHTNKLKLTCAKAFTGIK